MTAHRHKEHLNSKPAREIFLTSSSLSFSSLSSSTSWDDAIERNTKESTKGELSKASTQGSEMQGTNSVSTQPGPSPPLRLRPVQMRHNDYDPNRIPASVFGKTGGDVNWSEVSNDSLFSLKMDGYRMSNSQGFRQSNLKTEEVLMSGEFLAYSPVLSVKLEDAEEEISEVEEAKTEVASQQENAASSTPFILWNANPNNDCTLDQARPTKKRKTTKTSKKKKVEEEEEKKKKKKKNKCCIWSCLLCSKFPKCEVNLCCSCYKWRNCCCCFKGTKTIV